MKEITGGSSTRSCPSGAMIATASKRELALQKKKERAHTTAMWARLALLAPNMDENRGLPGYRSKAFGGRSKEELLRDVVQAVRLAQGLHSDDLVLQEGE